MRFVIGIDEVGRGALAVPMVATCGVGASVAAVLATVTGTVRNRRVIHCLHD